MATTMFRGEVTPASLRRRIEEHLTYTIGKDATHTSPYDWRMALSFALRDILVDRWFASTRRTYEERRKRVYYLSMEFLIGRLLEDAALNLGLADTVRSAIASLGLDYQAIVSDEPDAALGNGGLGRLAACFLDSLSTLGIAAMGYGIRYEHGLFRQGFVDGRQTESPEDWLSQRHAWEFERPEAAYRIGFGGTIREAGGRILWEPDDAVTASAYDTPVAGWRGRWVNTLRLWSARPTRLFDLEAFNRGDYLGASAPETLARTLSRVLYPDDTTGQGKELRLRQEYFFTAASIQDLVRRFLSEYRDLALLPAKVAIQLNDTHPAIAGPELVRLLADEHGMAMETAIETARGCLGYTNHTLLPEALESWPVDLMARVLPRHAEIIGRIDALHRRTAGPAAPAIVADGQVGMGTLAFVTAHRVNGVSALHTDLVRSTVFAGLEAALPGRIVNQTNGVTPRRWLLGCNPGLSRLITATIGPGWVEDLERLAELRPHLADPGFLQSFAAAKRVNKERLAAWLRDAHGETVDPAALFDVQIKRFHEYKRQFLNLIETVALWLAMKDEPGRDWTPRVKVFAGKAAPGYVAAKAIIRLINDAARVINTDPGTRGRLRIVFPPNYNVTMAERMVPAADLSEQISTAGKEASGTGNMKFAMNGAPTIGTLDGANVEIRERVGAEEFFLFGLTAAEVVARRAEPGFARAAIAASPGLRRALDEIAGGRFSHGEPGRHAGLVQGLEAHDYFLVTADFDSYWQAQRAADAAFADARGWARMAAANTAGSGWFSSDRTIRGYARDIWGVEPADWQAEETAGKASGHGPAGEAAR